MISLFSKSQNLVGLDVGTHSVKLLELAGGIDSLSLVHMGVAPLPPESFAEGRLAKPEAVAETIGQLASHLKVKGKSVAVSISGYDAMIKKIELPTMTEDELAERMQSELGQYIPYNIDEVDVDYQVIDASKNRPNFMDVMLVAAKKESISDFNNLVKLAGFDAAVVDVDFFALSNSFEAAMGFGDERVAMLDIGANKTLLNIIDKGVPTFTRSISIGGNQISDAIKDTFNISFEEAEAVKLGDQKNKYPGKDLQDIFVSTVSGWITQCRRALEFYSHNFPDDKIDILYLSGGSCQIPDLDKVFSEQLKIAVQIFNPISNIHHDTKHFDPAYVDYLGPQMAISFGLALRKNREK
jgi:type IV pilus assembly protein PilM